MENPLDRFKKLHQFYAGGFAYQTRELAAYLGVSTRTIQRWMREVSAPSEAQLEKIQAFLRSYQSEADKEA